MELELLLLEDRPAPRRVLQVMRRLAEVSAANTETWRRYSPQPQWVAYQRFVALTRQCLVQLLVLPEPAGAPSRA